MKKIISRNLTTLHFSGTIDEVIEELKKEGVYYSEQYTNLRIDYSYDHVHEECYYKHVLYGDKLETDEEESLRMKQEREYKKSQDEYQRKQYEQLKAKFENN